MRIIHFVLPDLASPSGGNVYNRHLRDGLTRLGWVVRPVTEWESIADGGLVLVDGLVASSAPETVVAQAKRLHIVALMHMPLFTDRERAMLDAVAAVIVTSQWSASRLTGRGQRGGGPAVSTADAGLNVHVAQPGVETAPLTVAHEPGTRLMCVASVTPVKGHDVLIEALSRVDGEWRCVCVGPLDRDPAFARELSTLDGRVEFTGPIEGDGFYEGADLVILPSRQESYGMVIIEALARGIPVLATETGGIPEALGVAAGGQRPGLLVPPGDAPALTGALRRWLTDPELRRTLRAAAAARRATLSDWTVTATVVSQVLTDALTNASVGR